MRDPAARAAMNSVTNRKQELSGESSAVTFSAASETRGADLRDLMRAARMSWLLSVKGVR